MLTVYFQEPRTVPAQGNQYMPMNECMKENERERKREGGERATSFQASPRPWTTQDPKETTKALDCTLTISQFSNLGDEMNSR